MRTVLKSRTKASKKSFLRQAVPQNSSKMKKGIEFSAPLCCNDSRVSRSHTAVFCKNSFYRMTVLKETFTMLVKIKNFLRKNWLMTLLQTVTFSAILVLAIIFKQSPLQILPMFISLIVMFLQAKLFYF